jgi:unsaturated rhamnogalacturonyl hydrolase
MRALAIAITGVLVSVSVSACAAPARVPAEQRTLALARRVADGWLAAHPAESLAWDWRDGVLVYGMWKFHLSSGEARYGDYVRAYMAHHLARGIEVSWSDHTTPGLAASELVLAGDTRFRPLVDDVVRYVMSAPRTERQKLVRHTGGRIPRWFLPRLLPDAWVDSLFHFVPTLLRYRALTGDARYLDEAIAQLAGFARNLQDPATGLFTHAYNDHPRDRPVPAFEKRAFWARGNGWMIVSLIEALEALPRDDPRARELSMRLSRQVQALGAVQTERGLFHTLLLDASTYEETAGSALIAYGLARGAALGFLDHSAAEQARRAWRGLLGEVVLEDGRAVVAGTSLGTNPNARRYRRIRQQTDVSYGVGAWLLAASALAGQPGP